MGKYNERFFADSEFFDMDKFIEADEKVLWRGKPNRKAHILAQVFNHLPIALLWLVFDVGLIAILITGGMFSRISPFMIIFLCVFFAFHLFPVWAWIGGIVTAGKQQKNTEYVITDKRIILKSGAIGINVSSVYYPEIVSVNLRVGVLDKLLKVGDIYISGGFKAQILWDIENPYDVTAALQKTVGELKRDAYYPNALREQK